MTEWLIEINSKLSKIEKILRKLGIKRMTTSETQYVKAATLEDAIKQTGRDPKKWNIIGKQIS